ncbi:MAG: hypothetical protein A3G23_06125 [Bacteroidetes bacterium RIFCSPLOWO2_12_FULL_37_12]|nr:MAG: hypothetical protein A3G23_06125 [Bacteroidetes bacterium RIFCSPLOWO2_12_FULL_37_12]
MFSFLQLKKIIVGVKNISPLLLFFSTVCISQTYNFQNFNVQHGLAQSQIYSLCQDKEGNLWFGTFGGGVCKYNGTEFTTYTTKEGLGDNDVYCLYTDSKGHIWIGTYDGLSKYIPSKPLSNAEGINSYVKPRFINYSRLQGMKCRRITSICEDHKGNIWAGGYGGLSKIAPLQIKESEKSSYDVEKKNILFKHYSVKDGLSDSIITGIKEDQFGKLYIGTYYGVNTLSYLPRKTTGPDSSSSILYFDKISMKDGLMNELIYEMAQDNLGQIWFLNSEGVTKLDPSASRSLGHYVFTNYKWDKPEFFKNEKNFPRSFLQDSHGDFWFVTDGAGLLHIIPDEDEHKLITLEQITEQNGLPTNFLWSIIQDYEGNLWIGTDGGGVARFRGKMFETYNTSHGLKDNTVFSILQDMSGRMWFGAYTKGVSIFDPSLPGNINQKFTYLDKTNGLPDDQIVDMITDKQGYIWIATYKGVARYNPDPYVSKENKIKVYLKEDSIPYYNQTSCLMQDSRRAIWVGTMYKGIMILGRNLNNPSDYTRTYLSKQNGLADNFINDILEDNEGNVWIATRKGLNLIAFKDAGLLRPPVYTLNKSSGLPDDEIMTLLQDKNGDIWITTQNGVARMSPEQPGLFNKVERKFKFQIYNITNGLNSDLVYFSQSDEEGNVWFGTNKGVVQYIMERDHFKTYGKEDGFTAIETNHKASCKDRDGNLWFGTIQGVVKYNPGEAKVNPQEPITQIQRLRIYYKDVTLPENHTFEYNQNYFTFDILGLSLTVPEKVKYQWKLDGFDKDWLPVTNETRVTYSNISPGTYTYQVRAANNDGLWNKKPVSFSFKILPPFWMTWWFFTSSGVTLILLIYGFIKWREKRLRKEKAALESKVTERTFELSKINLQLGDTNRKITKSINYAKRLQKAMLPQQEYIQRYLPQSFVLFKPRDIVSGDFYWMDVRDGKVLMAAADCTGHGVPGALMSIVGFNLLNQAVSDSNNIQPSLILGNLNNGMKRIFRESYDESNRRDGMDISLCVFDMKKNSVEFSGAHHPLYVVRNKNLTISPGSRLPIGKTIEGFSGEFTNHSLTLQKGDCLYMFSDGYMDQFGGPEDRKFMRTRFQEMVISFQDKEMHEQRDILDIRFEEWKGKRKQLDDILVIGVRV